MGIWTNFETFILGARLGSFPLAARNEIHKLRAGAADRLSTACLSVGAVGLLSPLVVPLFRPNIPLEVACQPEWTGRQEIVDLLKANSAECGHAFGALDFMWIAFGVLFWLGLGVMLHMIGEVFLTQMEER